MTRHPIGILAASVLLAAACAAPATTPSPTQPPSASATRPPITLSGRPMVACDAGGQPAVCGTLSVLENRADPSGRRIDIRVAVIPAIAATPEADAFVALDGGPGQAATEDLGWTASAFGAIHATRDILLVDQRGTGGSNRLAAPEAPDTTGLSKAEATAKIEAWRDTLLAALPGDPRFYTTSAAMDDLDEIRAALGYETIDLYGPSYGATAVQYYLRQHGDHVRAAILDGATLLDVPIFERFAPNSQHALEILFRRCAADAACQAAFPRLRADFETVVASLKAHPQTTSVADPWTGTPIVIDDLTFAGVVHGALMDWRAVGRLPSLIHTASGGAWDRVAQAMATAMGPRSSDNDTLLMEVVIRCSEAWARFDPGETARAGVGSYLRDAQIRAAENQTVLCGFAPSAALPPDDAAALTSKVPLLLTVGEADPQNPEANIADAPREFPNSVTVVVPGQAHTVAHLGCMPSIVEAFVEAGSVDGLDVSCAATGVPLEPFDTTL